VHPLLDYINQYVTTEFTEKDCEIILDHFTPKKIRKKQYLLAEGEICKHFAFIIKGAMRQFYLDEKGVEHVVNLSIENYWAGDQESFIKSTPSNYYIEAWEESDVLLLSQENKTKLSQQFPAFKELLTKLDENNIIATQRRITSFITMNAENKYNYFLENYPHFFKRFPNHIIASYIGITKDTLSRVRKKAASN
jgi:CRP-like cAMP-binding protein